MSLVADVNLLSPRAFYTRLDVFPFAIIYATLFYYKSMVLIPIVLAAHLLLFMFARSFIELHASLSHARTSIATATRVLVQATRNSGRNKIVDLIRSNVKGSISIANIDFEIKPFRFEFQKVMFSYDEESREVRKLQYLTTGSVADFLSSPGHTSKAAAIATMIWGFNEFDIPLQSFVDLYFEHLIAPFFVFQVVCLVLWSLDDYWYYSVLTLLMLLFFEGMMCKQRLNSLEMLRTMRRPAVQVFVYRDGNWGVIMSDALVPGDVISLTSGKKMNRGADIEENIVPCDVVLIKGRCVVNEAMLTGESVPQMKETLREADDFSSQLDIGLDSHADATWRRHIVFGGTSFLQHSESTSADEQDSAVSTHFPPPPDKGCVGVVVRTGFGSSQGDLMRKILFATERINSSSMETVVFISTMVCFAIVASAVVLHFGLQDETRNKFKLFLHCIMIVTSVVPPELPMELSLSVTNSLAALAKGLVYCTEPFRIPWAGKLDTLCFDKTGTLTKDKMVLKGIALPQRVSLISSESMEALEESVENVYAAEVCASAVLACMGVCHSLVVNKNEVLGDPMEIATFIESSFKIEGTTDIMNSEKLGLRMRIRKRFPFSSALKRMTVLVETTGATYMAFTKGAPEVLADKLIDVPPLYAQTYQYHMTRGKRVIAVAYKQLGPGVLSSSRDISRNDIESGLTFLGFLVFDCDLKPDSKSVIKELVSSDHHVVMITGDSPYTAADVSRRLGMTKNENLLMTQIVKDETTWGFTWRPVTERDESITLPSDVPFTPSTTKAIAESYRLCMTGPALAAIEKYAEVSGQSYGKLLKQICPHVTLFARVSPTQKESILIALKDAKRTTLMCGDGTNDVGALKAAHIGVSVVNDPEFEARFEDTKDASSAGTTGKKKAKGSSVKDRAARALAELHEQELDPTIVKLGDASIASPFTSRRTSIDAVLTVLRQGRCTLITTVQVYKILALNCLTSAYMMSALYLRGLKFGDTQMTATGIIGAGLFFFLSQTKPLLQIAPEKPPASVFHRSISLSILGQFCVHFASLLCILKLSEQYIASDDSTLAPDVAFQPNIINTSMFLLQVVMQTNNFVVNYRGHPFTQSIGENIYLWRSIQVIYAVVVVAVGGQFEPLNDLLQMTPFPVPQYQVYLLGVLAFNFGATWSIEKFCQKLE